MQGQNPPTFQTPMLEGKKAYRTGGNQTKDEYALIKQGEILVVDGYQCNVTVTRLDGELRVCGDFNHLTILQTGPAAQIKMMSASSRILNQVAVQPIQCNPVACGRGMAQAIGVPSRIDSLHGGMSTTSSMPPIRLNMNIPVVEDVQFNPQPVNINPTGGPGAQGGSDELV